MTSQLDLGHPRDLASRRPTPPSPAAGPGSAGPCSPSASSRPSPCRGSSTRRWRWTSPRWRCSRSRSTSCSASPACCPSGTPPSGAARPTSTGLVAIHSACPSRWRCWPVRCSRCSSPCRSASSRCGARASTSRWSPWPSPRCSTSSPTSGSGLTGGENGLQAVPKDFFGVEPGGDRLVLLLLRRAADHPARDVGRLADRALAVRPGAGRHPRQRRPVPGRSATTCEKYKVIAFVLSAGLAGLAGGVFAISHGFVALPDAGLDHVRRGRADHRPRRHRHAVGRHRRRRRHRHRWRTSSPPSGFDGIGIITGTVFILVVLLFRRGVWGTVRHYWLQWQARRRRVLSRGLSRWSRRASCTSSWRSGSCQSSPSSCGDPVQPLGDRVDVHVQLAARSGSGCRPRRSRPPACRPAWCCGCAS